MIQCTPEMDWTGDYSFSIPVHRSYMGGDRLIISGVNGNRISGKVVFDRDIGPEARLPMDWEKVYEIPFDAELTSRQFAFDTATGEGTPGEYRYHVTVTLPGRKDGGLKISVDLTNIRSQTTQNYSFDPVLKNKKE